MAGQVAMTDVLAILEEGTAPQDSFEEIADKLMSFQSVDGQENGNEWAKANSQKPFTDCNGCDAFSLFFNFSSTSGVLGLSRSSDYSGSNAMMDAFKPWRKSQGLQLTSVNWGAVLGTGLASGGIYNAGDPTQNLKNKKTISGKFMELKNIFHQVLMSGPKPQVGYQYRMAIAWFDEKHEERTKSNTCFQKREERWVAGDDVEDFPPDMNEMQPAYPTTSTDFHEASNLGKAGKGDFEEIEDFTTGATIADEDDRVLILCNTHVSSEISDKVGWTFKRNGEKQVGSEGFTHHSGQSNHSATIAWVDRPGTPGNVKYTLCRKGDSALAVSKSDIPSTLLTASFDGRQTTTSRSTQGMTIEPRNWFCVPGMAQMTANHPGEKVLIVCSVTYSANWSSPNSRGVFRIIRDGMSLDYGPGCQAVKATERDVKRTAVFTILDDPEPGLHLYQVEATVQTAGDENHQMRIEEDERQLALIRMWTGAGSVGKPKDTSTADAKKIDRDSWMEAPFLSTTVKVENDSDRVLITYNTNLHPTTSDYDAYATLMRVGGDGSEGPKNLGDNDTGLWQISNKLTAYDEYPMGSFVDSPGAGTFIYSLCLKSKGDTVLAGPDGSIGVVALPKP